MKVADILRMQNAINWAARSASIQTPLNNRAYFLGSIIDELKALDNGAPLTPPEKKHD